MPRVHLNKKKYLENDLYLFFKGEMAKKQLTQSDIGKLIGCNQSNVAKKMHNHTLSTYELITLFEVFETDAQTIGKLLGGAK